MSKTNRKSNLLHHPTTQSVVFIGVVALAAISAATVIFLKANEAIDSAPPALTLSKQRAKTPLPKSTTTKTVSPAQQNRTQ